MCMGLGCCRIGHGVELISSLVLEGATAGAGLLDFLDVACSRNGSTKAAKLGRLRVLKQTQHRLHFDVYV